MLPRVEDMVEGICRGTDVPLSTGECRDVAVLMLETCAVDVMGFSPKRFTALAGSYGLRPGVAIDLEEMKPDGNERWNLDLE